LPAPVRTPVVQAQVLPAPVVIPKLPIIPQAQNSPENDTLWQKASSITDFYNALQNHSIYQKPTRTLSFTTPKNTNPNAPYLLIFHSPQELASEATSLLQRLFKKLEIDLSTCSMSFFIKCNSNAMPREKKVLKEMLQKEVALLNPKKIIFFRETPKTESEDTKIDSAPITFAGKEALILYSLTEMHPSKEKMIETFSNFSAWIQENITSRT